MPEQTPHQVGGKILLDRQGAQFGIQIHVPQAKNPQRNNLRRGWIIQGLVIRGVRWLD